MGKSAIKRWDKKTGSTPVLHFKANEDKPAVAFISAWFKSRNNHIFVKINLTKSIVLVILDLFKQIPRE